MLNSIRNLLDSFERSEVRYCHWKSNERLEEALRGETDLDLLCHREDRTSVQRVLLDNGFVRLDDVSFTGYPGIENYVGYDVESGSLVHVHLHFELTFGTPFLKEYVTPWGPFVLERTILDSETGIPITDPSTELFLLAVRYCLKIRRLNIFSRRKYVEEFHEEYSWLADRADETDLRAISRDLLNPRAADELAAILEAAPPIDFFHDLRQIVRSELRTFSSYRDWSVPLISYFRKGFRGIGKLNREVFYAPVPFRRGLSHRGSEVAFIGVDGSGKSTHLSRTETWLSWKLDVQTVYFGSGDGRSSILRYPLKLLNQVRERFFKGDLTSITTQKRAGETHETRDDGSSQQPGSNGVGLAKALWAIVLAREKMKKRQRAIRARNRGMVVLMDRYPQNQFAGINDGPLLDPWRSSSHRSLRWLAGWEASIYEELETKSPDLVIKLEVDPEVGKQRKPETPMDILTEKSKVIEGLEYDNSRVVSVDAERDIDAVFATIKSEIWTEM